MRVHFVILFLLIQTLAFAQFEENISQIGNWQDPDALSIIPGYFDSKYHDVWAVEVNGTEYAIMSTAEGTHIIDIEDTNNLEVLHTIPAAYQGEYALHRDYHDYNGYLYSVCDEGPSTLQIIDIRNLPDEANLVYESDELFRTTHNIFIDTTHAKLYAAGAAIGENSFNLLVASLANPAQPELLYSYNEGYVHDLYVRDNIGYLNQADQGFYMVEFSDTGYTVLGTLTNYPDQGYNHSGWLSEDGNYYALCDENHGLKVKLLDVSDPTDIKVVSLFGSDVTDNSIAHNVLIKDHYAFVSYYYDGLQIFDISNPGEVTKVGYYDTYLDDNDTYYRGAWGVYPHLESEKILVSDMHTGLYVFEVDLAPVADFEINFDGESTIDFIDNSRWKPTAWEWTINGDTTNIISTDANYSYIMEVDLITEICLKVSNDKGESIKCKNVEMVLNNECANNSDNVNLTFNRTGWNLISFDVSPADKTIESVFGNIIQTGNLEFIVGFDNEAKIYNPNQPEFLNTLVEIKDGFGYWVKVTNTDVLQVEGTCMNDNFRKPLEPGWNLIAYPPDAPQAPSMYFADLISNGELEFVTGFDNGAKIFNPNGPPFLNTLQQMENGFGYWVKLGNPSAKTTNNLTNVFSFINGTSNLPAGEQVNVLCEAGKILAVLDVIDDSFLMTTTIYGDDATTILKENISIGEKLRFSWNNQILDSNTTFKGDFGIEKVELEFKLPNLFVNELAVKIYPVPAKDILNFEIDASEENDLLVQIFDIKGSLIHRIDNTSLTAGKQTVNYNVEHLAEGIYTYKIITGSKIKAGKFNVLK